MYKDQNDGNYNSDYDERALLEDCTDPEDIQKEKQHCQEIIFLAKHWESTSPGEHLPS